MLLPFERHALHLDVLGDRDKTDDPGHILFTLHRIACAAGMQVMDTSVRRVSGEGDADGWSGVTIIKSSHICIHTWPQCGGIMFDLVSCKPFDRGVIGKILFDAFDVTGLIREITV